MKELIFSLFVALSALPSIAATGPKPEMKITGVGMVLEFKEGQGNFVRDLIPNAPAARSGLIRIGDQILAVQSDPSQDWVPVSGLPLEKAVELIRGPVGTTVGVEIKNATGVSDRIHLTREEIEVPDDR